MLINIRDVPGEKYMNTMLFLTEQGREYENFMREYHDDVRIGSAKLYTNIFIKMLGFIGSPEGKSIIEIGCGPAYFLHTLRKMGADVYGVDINENGGNQQKYGVNFVIKNILEFPDDALLSPQDLFPQSRVKKFDALLTRDFLERHLGFGKPGFSEKEVEKMLKMTRNLSDLQIHETGLNTSLLRDIDVGKLGYDVLGFEETHFPSCDIHVLKRDIKSPLSSRTGSVSAQA